jgi:hypothetical protein
VLAGARHGLLAWGIAHSGAIGVRADAPNTIQPGVTFGKGFGDLPDSFSWLRPFAVTGSLVDEEPVGSGGRALVPNLASASFQNLSSPAVETLHWGFSIQYSTLYPLEDLMPSVFGKPLLTGAAPDRRQIAW